MLNNFFFYILYGFKHILTNMTFEEFKSKENNVKIEYINYFDNLENRLNEILKNVRAK